MSRFKILVFAMASLSLSSCGAQAEAPLKKTESESSEVTQSLPSQMTRAPNWDVVQDESHIKFSAQQEGKDFTGEFKVFEAQIYFDEESLETSSVSVTVSLKQVDAGTGDRNSTLPGQEWFNVKNFPEAVYNSTDITKTGVGTYLSKGYLTLKGIEKPLDLPFTLKIENKQARMTGRIDLDRTVWNIGEDPWNTDEWISKTVSLDLIVVATSP